MIFARGRVLLLVAYMFRAIMTARRPGRRGHQRGPQPPGAWASGRAAKTQKKPPIYTAAGTGADRSLRLGNSRVSGKGSAGPQGGIRAVTVWLFLD